MDFTTLKKRAATRLNLLDSAGAILTGKDITEAKIGQSINDAYIEEIVSVLMGQYPGDYEGRENFANYTVTGTADGTSTGTTLVATTSIFDSSMVGLYVENYTDTAYAKIKSYTSATTVTLDTTIDDTWDGDSLRIIDNRILINTSSLSYTTVRRVDIRKTATSSYKKATSRFYNDAFPTGAESFTDPIYIITTKDVSGVATKAIEVYPNWTASDDNAMKIIYLDMPTALSGDTDVPILPLGHHKFLSWYAVMEGAILRRDDKLYELAEREYEKGKRNLFKNYRPTSQDGNVKMRVPNRVGSMMSRDI